MMILGKGSTQNSEDIGEIRDEEEHFMVHVSASAGEVI
jgi:hypothetical protein